ncbi:MAG: peptidylprolyl isomerase [Hyphomicrobiales bacterium]|nr:peptidylprolyl isomerase [Hyphomicrobiales bacterium]
MLNALRKKAGSWVAQLFIALLVLSFAVWGVADIFTGFRADTVATVGDASVSSQRFNREYQLAKRRFSQQLRQPITDQQARAFGLPNQVLGRLVAEAALNDQAMGMRLGVSGDTLAQQIASDPSFQNSSGAFDRARFIQLVNEIGMTENQFIDVRRELYVRQQLVRALGGALEVPDAYLRAFHDYQSEQRDISYLVLKPTDAGDIPDPTETELVAFFDEHKSDWRAPELRSVNIMGMTPGDLADPDGIGDDEAQAIYDAQAATRFTEPERRKVDQIVFDDAADASQAASSLADGTTFDELVAARGLTAEGISLGLVTGDEILDEATREAAFSLESGAASAIVEGRFGPVIVRVSAIEPAVVRPFDDVKGAIKLEVAEAQAAQEIADQFDVIEDARAGGTTLGEIATNYGLKLMEFPAVDSQGNDGNGDPIADLPSAEGLIAEIFETDVGLENNAIPFESGYVWYEVTAVDDARDRQLTEVRDRVAAAYRDAEIDKRLTAAADEIRDRLARGESVETIAEEKSKTAKSLDSLTRSAPADGDLTGSVIEAAFGGPLGHTAVAAGAGQDKVVLIVTNTTVPPYFAGSPEDSRTAERLTSDLSAEYLDQYVRQLQSNLGGVAVNAVAYELVVGSSEHTGR